MYREPDPAAHTVHKVMKLIKYVHMLHSFIVLYALGLLWQLYVNSGNELFCLMGLLLSFFIIFLSCIKRMKSVYRTGSSNSIVVKSLPKYSPTRYSSKHNRS